jgi:hypothetical protein
VVRKGPTVGLGSRAVSIGPILAGGVPAAGAIAAAAVAARAARRSKATEVQATQLLDAERRISESRQKVFEPMVEALGRFLQLTMEDKFDDAAAKVFLSDMGRFAHWVQIYGSDESVIATMHFLQAVWQEAPTNVLIRLQGELIIATRRELGYPDTRIGCLESFALRINDVFTTPGWRADLTDPLDDVFARHRWLPPWVEPQA